MNNKLSSSVITELSFLTLKEMQSILVKFNDSYDNDRYGIWKYITKHYSDEQITPFLKGIPIYQSSDNRSKEEKLQALKNYYVKNPDNIVITNAIPMFRKGKKKQETTLKDRVFAVLDENMENYEELNYEGVLESGIMDIAENTFKTILSQWRKERGIKVKRGRKIKKLLYK